MGSNICSGYTWHGRPSCQFKSSWALSFSTAIDTALIHNGFPIAFTYRVHGPIIMSCSICVHGNIVCKRNVRMAWRAWCGVELTPTWDRCAFSLTRVHSVAHPLRLDMIFEQDPRALRRPFASAWIKSRDHIYWLRADVKGDWSWATHWINTQAVVLRWSRRPPTRPALVSTL